MKRVHFYLDEISIGVLEKVSREKKISKAEVLRRIIEFYAENVVKGDKNEKRKRIIGKSN